MELKWLQDFIALARCASFSAAANDRNVTQPALSRRIRSLESWLGTTLVNRAVFPIVLTPHGREFLTVAQEIVASSTGIREDFRQATGADRRQVRIVTLHTLAVGVVPELIAPILHGDPQLNVEIITSIQGMESHYEALDSGHIQIMIAYAQRRPSSRAKDYLTKLVAMDVLVPVASQGYIDAGGVQDLRQAKSIPLLTYSPFTFSSVALEKVLASLAGRLLVRAESPLAETLKALVRQDLGIAWLPRTAVANELATGELQVLGGERFLVPLEISAWCRVDLTDQRAKRVFERLPNTLDAIMSSTPPPR